MLIICIVFYSYSSPSCIPLPSWFFWRCPSPAEAKCVRTRYQFTTVFFSFLLLVFSSSECVTCYCSFFFRTHSSVGAMCTLLWYSLVIWVFSHPGCPDWMLCGVWRIGGWKVVGDRGTPWDIPDSCWEFVGEFHVWCGWCLAFWWVVVSCAWWFSYWLRGHFYFCFIEYSWTNSTLTCSSEHWTPRAFSRWVRLFWCGGGAEVCWFYIFYGWTDPCRGNTQMCHEPNSHGPPWSCCCSWFWMSSCWTPWSYFCSFWASTYLI